MVVLLAEEVGDDHHGEVAGEGGPCGAHVVEARNQQPVEHQRDGRTEEGDVGPELGLAGELVPYREVVEDAEEEVGHQQDRHDGQSYAVGRAHEILHKVHIEHDADEDDGADQHEGGHHLGVGLLRVLVFRLAEEEGLGGVFESLDEDGHHDGDLVARAVDAHGGLWLGGERQTLDEHAVHGLVDDAGQTEDQQRESVAEHLLPELPVEDELLLEDAREEHQQGDDAGHEVGDEDVADPDFRVVDGVDESRVGVLGEQPRTEQQEEKVEEDVDEDVGDLDGREPYRTVQEPQMREEDGGERIDPDDDGKPAHVFGVGGVAEPVGDGLREDGAKHDEEGGGDNQRPHNGAIDAVFDLVVLRELEEGGLHAVGENHDEEARPGVELAHHAVVGGVAEQIGVERHEQVVEQPAEHGGAAVYGRLPGQFLDFVVSHGNGYRL